MENDRLKQNIFDLIDEKSIIIENKTESKVVAQKMRSRMDNPILGILEGEYTFVYPRELEVIKGVAENVNLDPKPPHMRRKLSKRQIEILQLFSQEMTDADIALSLSITQKTIKHHLVNAFLTLNVNNIEDALIKAREFGVVKPTE